METGVAIAVGVGALVLVLVLTKQQEARTAAMIAAIQNKPKGPQTLSFQDGLAIAGTAVATIYGGPGAGSAAAKALAPQ